MSMECYENTRLPGFGLPGRAKLRLAGDEDGSRKEKLQLGGSKEGGWGYTNSMPEAKMETPDIRIVCSRLREIKPMSPSRFIRTANKANFLVMALAGCMVLEPARAQDAPTKNNIEARALDIELGRTTPAAHEQLLSSGPVYTLLQASGELDRRAEAHANDFKPSGPSHRTAGCSNTFVGGGAGSNVRVNQDCSQRRQAEEVVAVNPTDPNNLIAGANDSRIGFNHCSYAWSFDGGREVCRHRPNSPPSPRTASR